MELLEQRILKDGKVRPGGILKVDSFLNHQIDSALTKAMAEEFHRLFAGEGVTKVLTVEASGIAAAIMTAWEFGVPMVFAKKSKTKNIADDVYTAEVASFTHGTVNTIMVAKPYLNPGDRVLLIDDFLARGQALLGLKSLVEQAGGTVVGAGILVEKAFQGGSDLLRQAGVRVESLARVGNMTPGNIEFL